MKNTRRLKSPFFIRFVWIFSIINCIRLRCMRSDDNLVWQRFEFGLSQNDIVQIAQSLIQKGHDVSYPLVRRMLGELGYALKTTKKTEVTASTIEEIKRILDQWKTTDSQCLMLYKRRNIVKLLATLNNKGHYPDNRLFRKALREMGYTLHGPSHNKSIKAYSVHNIDKSVNIVVFAVDQIEAREKSGATFYRTCDFTLLRKPEWDIYAEQGFVPDNVLQLIV